MKKNSIYLDRSCYDNLVDFMNIQPSSDTKGRFADLNFFYQDGWLLDSAVIDQVYHRKGTWEVHLVFAHTENPFQFIKRRVGSYMTKQKAEFAANILRRQAAKDPRGTLKLDPKFFLTCEN